MRRSACGGVGRGGGAEAQQPLAGSQRRRNRGARGREPRGEGRSGHGPSPLAGEEVQGLGEAGLLDREAFLAPGGEGLQALCALVFLYKHVLGQSVGELEDVVRAKRRRRIPVVLTRDEVREILRHVDGVPWIVLTLLYGTGMRLMECLRLRVQNIDFAQKEVTVRDGKGGKDRRTVLPQTVKPALQTHLATVKKIHQSDLREGFGRADPGLGNLPMRRWRAGITVRVEAPSCYTDTQASA